MLKRLIVVGLCLGCASTAHAGPLRGLLWDKTFTAGLIAGQGFDAASTYRFLHNGSGCTETNAWLGPRPSAGKILAQKSFTVGISLAYQALAYRVHERAKHEGAEGWARTAKWINRGVLLMGGLFGADAGVHNVRMCGW